MCNWVVFDLMWAACRSGFKFKELGSKWEDNFSYPSKLVLRSLSWNFWTDFTDARGLDILDLLQPSRASLACSLPLWQWILWQCFTSETRYSSGGVLPSEKRYYGDDVLMMSTVKPQPLCFSSNISKRDTHTHAPISYINRSIMILKMALEDVRIKTLLPYAVGVSSAAGFSLCGVINNLSLW